MLDDVEAIELITSHEIRLRLKRPSGWVLRALAEIPILPMHVYDGSLLAGGALVGTGPWKLASNKGGVVHLTRYDKYWGRPPAIADLEFVYQPDAAIALTAAKRGELDIVPALIPAHWPEQASAPGVAAAFRPLAARAAAAALPRVQRRARRRSTTLASATRSRCCRSPRDRASACSTASRGPRCGRSGRAVRSTAPRPPSPTSIPAAAGKLLDAAGWIDTDKDGIRDQDGKQLRLVMIGGEQPRGRRTRRGPPMKTERDYFVEAARRAGVDHRGQDRRRCVARQARATEGTYDLVELAWSGMVDSDITSLRRRQGSGAARAAARRSRARHDGRRVGSGGAREARGRARRGARRDVADRRHRRRRAAGPRPAPGQGVQVWDGWLDLSQLKLREVTVRNVPRSRSPARPPTSGRRARRARGRGAARGPSAARRAGVASRGPGPPCARGAAA